MHAIIYALVAPYLLSHTVQAACTPSSSSTADLQNALQQGGDGYVLQLCPGETYNLDQVLNFTAANQVNTVVTLLSLNQLKAAGNIHRRVPYGWEPSNVEC